MKKVRVTLNKFKKLIEMLINSVLSIKMTTSFLFDFVQIKSPLTLEFYQRNVSNYLKYKENRKVMSFFLHAITNLKFTSFYF